MFKKYDRKNKQQKHLNMNRIMRDGRHRLSWQGMNDQEKSRSKGAGSGGHSGRGSEHNYLVYNNRILGLYFRAMNVSCILYTPI